MDALSIGGFLLMGLTGSLHCAGMCGPLVWMMPFQHFTGLRRWLAVGLYHAGRITAYSTIALLFYNLRTAFDPRWQQQIALISGALLVIFGLVSFLGKGSALLRPLSSLVIAGLSGISGKRAPAYLAVTGFLNGLLPCGMVYVALGAAMRSPDAGSTVVSIVAFGLGTMPMLVAVTALRRRIRIGDLRWANAAILVLGLFVMLRGANLGIPYLSPERAATEQRETPAMNCCHRPQGAQ